MIFSNKSKKKAEAFCKYVENEIIPSLKNSEIVTLIENKLTATRELIQANEWGVAFELIATELIEQGIVVNRNGQSLAEEFVSLTGLDESWVLHLRRLKSKGYVSGSWTLQDGEISAKRSRYTFYKPSRNITNQLKIDNFVKLIFKFESTRDADPSGERMWVRITEIMNDKFKGVLDNDPYFISDLYYKDTIEFDHRHIIDHDLDLIEPNLVDQYIDRCLVTNRVLYDKASVNYLYREEPMEIEDGRDYVDSGWRILAGDESDEYMEDAENYNVVSLGAVLSVDDSFVAFLDSDIGASYLRNPSTGQFEPIED